MSHVDQRAQGLLTFYREHARVLLEEHKVPTLDGLDREADVLARALQSPAMVRIGFVGGSQVGKSSLINALLERRALPAGGIGPLTAQATRVEHADENRIEVEYHDRTKLNELRFGIETYLARRGELDASHSVEETDAPSDEVLNALDEDVGLDETETAETAASSTKRQSERGEYMLSQAKLLLHVNDGTASRAALLDGIRGVLGQKAAQEEATSEALQIRIAEIRAKLGQRETLRQSELDGKREFNRALGLRAAGWLSPLVKSLSLHLNIPFLANVKLVDLPGIGVVGDPAGLVAEDFVRREGDALVIVTRNSGITKDLAALLEQTGVLTKLLFGAGNDIPAVRVLIAVTHLDGVAYEQHSRLAQEALEDDEPLPDKHELYASLAADMCAKVKMQLRGELLNSDAFEELEPSQRAARENVVERLCSDLQVVCVSAPDYLDLIYKQKPRFLERIEATGVPYVAEALAKMSRDATTARELAVTTAERELRLSLVQHIKAIKTTYEKGGGTATEEWARFREELARELAQLKPKMAASHGEVLGLLRNTLPERIAGICMAAERVAIKRLDRIRRRALDLRWSSLNAALTRQGRWDKQSLDYPGDLTRAMCDAVAAEWEPKIVEAVRASVQIMAKRDLALIEELCAVAARHDESLVAESHIESQKKILQSSARSCVRWTQDRLEEMRNEIQTRLGEIVIGPIEAACKRAVDRRRNRGQGAVKRIVETFHEGSLAAVEQAREGAGRLLTGRYQVLVSELSESYLEPHHDPLQAAFEALTRDELERARGADTEGRRRVTAACVTMLGELGQEIS